MNPPNSNVYGQSFCLLDFQSLKTAAYSKRFFDRKSVGSGVEKFFLTNSQLALFYGSGSVHFFGHRNSNHEGTFPSLIKLDIFMWKVGNKNEMDLKVVNLFKQILEELKVIFSSATLDFSPTCSTEILMQSKPKQSIYESSFLQFEFFNRERNTLSISRTVSYQMLSKTI